MSDRFRLAIIGVDHPHGAHWRELLTHFADEINVVGVVPAFGGGLASLEERYVEAPRFASLAELLKGQPCDGALVCLPSAETPAAIERLARAGKHVLSEKPCGVDAAAFEPAYRAVQEARVAFQNGYLWRYDDCADRLRRMTRDGQFGRLISVEMTYVTSDAARRGPDHYLFDPVQSGGGYFHWLGCHYLDLVRYLTGQAVVGVTARVGVFGAVPLNVEDGGAVILDLEQGGIATLVGGYWIPRWAGETRWTLRGSNRWVQWEPSRPGTSGALAIHGPQPQWHAMEDAYSSPADATPGYGGRRGVALIADWLAAARSGRPCRNTIESTRGTLQLLDAVYQSAQEQRRVECCVPAD
ncbi:MAG: Gfo/Idh/MocA family oxidoreductase [Pirellulales bacterium]